MKTINIKGKEYVEVNERLKYFRANFKGFSLETNIIELDSENCVIKAQIKNDQGMTVATGHAQEMKSSSFINKTSFVENCETSAWGRALANFGIGIDSSVASADEVDMAIKISKTKEKTVKKEKLTKTKFDAMIEFINNGKQEAVINNLSKYDLTKTQQEKIKTLLG
tara:strand:- start:16898 stop:17398 length:501 start_codon:yes stop_codon:yes gene_type:complete